MHKVLWEEPHIGSYSALLLLALFLGYLLARWRAVRSGIPGRHIDNLTLCIVVASLIGARLFSWWFYFPPGKSLWQAITLGGGGMVFYGGLIFGIITTLAYAKLARLSLGNLMDSLAPGVALGLAVGRIGCFMAGCCWGDVCVTRSELTHPSSHLAWQLRTFPAISGPEFPLAVSFPAEAGAYRQHRKLGLIADTAGRSRPVHPVQLYEAVLAFGLCLLLHHRFVRRRWPGQIALGLALGYAAIRFATEFLRGDNATVYWGLTLSQVISVLIAAVSLGLLAWRRWVASSDKQKVATPAPSSTGACTV